MHMTHTLDQLKAMTDAELSRLAFELGLASDNVKLCTDEGCDPQTWAEESEPHEHVKAWLPSIDLNQARDMANEHFKHNDGRYWRTGNTRGGKAGAWVGSIYQKTINPNGLDEIFVECESGQEARCLTIAAILAKEAMKCTSS